MAPKMVTNFRRSLSFPNHPSSMPQKIVHVRSASLPCRSQPNISLLRDQIADINSWSSSGSRTSAWLCDGLSRMKTVHESLDDLLHLPQPRESLRGAECSSLVEKLLEDFLLFVDVYGSFQTLILRLREEYSEAQIAMRRKDDSEIVIHSKNLSKIAKEIGKLVSSFVSVGRVSMVAAGPSYEDAAVLVEAVNEVVKVTVLVSVLLFRGISSSPAFRKPSCLGGLSFGKKSKIAKVDGSIREFLEIDLGNLKKKSEDEMKMLSKKMHEMEDCMVEIENCAEGAFRSLISTRVSLLNVLTQ